ncbi:MAG TPA: hemolysin III family protein [Gemmataceae bacterium]|nr:hemolysin III family protein [Gemmataceae bacterium]
MDSLRDPVASASHFLMSFLAVVATAFMVRLAGGDRGRRLCVLIFGLSTIVLYAASGLYHSLRLPVEQLRLYQKIDMSAIFLLIAGSCMPTAGILLRGRFRAILLTGEWLFAAIGIASLWLLPKADHRLMVSIYAVMGWIGMAGVWQMWKATGSWGLFWICAGAFFYTLGAVIELANWPVLVPGVIRSHELLHFCDMTGTACHIVFVIKYALPYRAPAVLGEDAEESEFAIPAPASVQAHAGTIG